MKEDKIQELAKKDKISESYRKRLYTIGCSGIIITIGLTVGAGKYSAPLNFENNQAVKQYMNSLDTIATLDEAENTLKDNGYVEQASQIKSVLEEINSKKEKLRDSQEYKEYLADLDERSKKSENFAKASLGTAFLTIAGMSYELYKRNKAQDKASKLEDELYLSEFD